MEKWRSVADLATQKCELKLASEALRKAKDHGGLLLLATSSGDKGAVQNLAEGESSSLVYGINVFQMPKKRASLTSPSCQIC